MPVERVLAHLLCLLDTVLGLLCVGLSAGRCGLSTAHLPISDGMAHRTALQRRPARQLRLLVDEQYRCYLFCLASWIPGPINNPAKRPAHALAEHR